MQFLMEAGASTDRNRISLRQIFCLENPNAGSDRSAFIVLQIALCSFMRFDQIAGDAAECPLSLFANPGRNRSPKNGRILLANHLS